MPQEPLYEDNDMCATKDVFLRYMVNHGYCLDYDDAETEFYRCLKEGTIWKVKA